MLFSNGVQDSAVSTRPRKAEAENPEIPARIIKQMQVQARHPAEKMLQTGGRHRSISQDVPLPAAEAEKTGKEEISKRKIFIVLSNRGMIRT